MKWNSSDSNPFNWHNFSGFVPVISSNLSNNTMKSAVTSTTTNNNDWYKTPKIENFDENEEEYEECPYISKCQLEPERIIFNPPATIVYWNDGTKTVVKTSDEWEDEFEPEVGFAMAFLRKYFGDRGTYLRMINETSEWHEPKGSKNGRKVE